MSAEPARIPSMRARRVRRVAGRYTLRVLALGYLLLLLVLPVGYVVFKVFQGGLVEAWDAVTSPEGLAALKLTLKAAAIAVPLNAAFGVLIAILLVRRKVRGSVIINPLIDLPLALSPVVVGLSLILVWGKDGWFGGWLVENGYQVIFSTPGIVLATIFVSVPFVAREVIPVLREIGTDQEQAASTLGAGPVQTFWRITLPAIRTGLLYGVILTVARAIGEYGAVAVVSGNISGKTETMTLRVEDRFERFDITGAYATALVLAAIAVGVVIATSIIDRGGARRGDRGH